MRERRRLTRGILAGILLSAGVLLTACSSGGKTSDLLVVTPDPKSHATAVPVEMHISCDVLPEPSAQPSTALTFSGACAFDHTSKAQCVVRVDDFYLYIDRKMANSDRLAAYINVEKYHGPGTYTKNSVVSLQVVHGGQLYIWEQNAATLTVAPDGRSVTVPSATLSPSAGTPAGGIETVDGGAACQ